MALHRIMRPALHGGPQDEGPRAALDRARAGWDARQHPFLRRWREGRLGLDALALFACEYDDLVLAAECAARRAAELAASAGLPRGVVRALAERALDDADQVDRWRAFARATGWSGASAWWYGAEPLPGTERCARTWAGDGSRSLSAHLAVLHAIRSDQAAIAGAQMHGPDRPAAGSGACAPLAYFDFAARRHDDDMRLVLRALEAMPPPHRDAGVYAAACAAHRAHRSFLDEVAACCGEQVELAPVVQPSTAPGHPHACGRA